MKIARIHLSVRLLLLGTACFGVVFGIFARMVQVARVQQQVFSQMTANGASLVYFGNAWTRYGKVSVTRGQIPGLNLNYTVGSIVLPYPCTNDAIHPLKNFDLSEVGYLEISSPYITADAISGLRGLNNLRGIFLRGSRLDDSWISSFVDAGVENISWADFGETRITDVGIVNLFLHGNRDILSLQLDSTDISDRSIHILCKLTKLQLLRISNTNISFDGLEVLKKSLTNTTIHHSRKVTVHGCQG